MSRDIYTSLSGAQAAWREMEVLANNVANTNTAGFRAGKVAFTVDGEGDGPLGKTHVGIEQVAVDQSQGALRGSSDPGHLAVDGEGFFQVQVGDRQLLTRDGSFRIDESGRMVNGAGHPVLGEGGPIQLEAGEAYSVGIDGKVIGDVSGEVGKIRLVMADVIEPAGTNLYQFQGDTREADGSIRQFHLEGSNADPVASMVELMQNSRYFEAYQKAMQTSDELDSRANRSGGS
ncbi:MAG: flagellar hook-basal body protein [Proteobacteria bacterium]|nr:flagellar hook-basal body protein [Pseudomonadota bacterium]